MDEKMDEKEFLKLHPSLRGIVLIVDTKEKPTAVHFDDIHKTQIDKQKVKIILEDIKDYTYDCETISNFKKLYTVLTNIRQLIDKKEREIGI